MIYFDLTSSMTYIGRNPVGIVRVEMKLAQYALDHLSPEEITFCYFDLTLKKVSYLAFSDAQGVLNQIGHALPPPAPMQENAVPQPAKESTRELLRLYRGKTVVALKRIYHSLFPSRPVPPQPTPQPIMPPERLVEPLDVSWNEKDTFVTVGLIWDIWPTDRLYAAKKLRKFQVVGMIYDLVPYQVPEFCRGVPATFFQTVVDLLWCSEKIISISQCSCNDLKKFIAEYDLPSPSIQPNILGMNVASLPEGYVPPASELDTSRLKPGRFILQVGTMEPRKNHQLIYNAYRYLIQNGNRDKLLPWVIVGAQAWGLNDLMESIKLNPALYPKLVVFSNHVSDETLAWLYHNCAFTVYPSYYEGWGLPVSESLAFGKFCLTGTNDALREAAAGFAESLDPFDTIAWANRLLELMTQPDWVQQKNAEIRQNYHIRTWLESGRDFFKTIID